MKKVTGDAADEHYRRVDSDTGEVYQLTPEFNRMSLKPGIGAEWYQRYCSDVFPHDFVVVNGVKSGVPRFYKKRAIHDPRFDIDSIEYRRFLSSREHLEDKTPERLKVREVVVKASLSRLKRSI